MFLNKKTILIFILIILIIFFYIKLKNKERYQNFSPDQLLLVTDIINKISNKEESKKSIMTDINKNIINNSKVCLVDSETCLDDIITKQNTYFKKNYYEFTDPNFTAKEINTKKICFGNNCIDGNTINDIKKNNYFDRLRQFKLFDLNKAIIYPSLDNNDVSGNFNTIIDICGNNGTIPILIDSNFVSSNTLTTGKQRALFKTAIATPTKLPFNDAYSKFAYKLTPQNMVYYDTSGFLIKIPNQYSDINFNVLWLNVPNYVYSTFQVCLYNISTKQILKKYGSFGSGLKLENKFDNNFDFYNVSDSSGNYFDWIPVPIYGNNNSDDNQRLVVSVDRAQSAGTTQTDISGFIVTGIGFSTNPYNYSRINPTSIYYNLSNQKSEFFGGTTYIGFDTQTKTLLNLNKQLTTTAAIADIRNVKSTDVSGINIFGSSTMFSMQILPPRENNYKIIYFIGKTSDDLTGLKMSISIRTGQEYLIDNLVDISKYPPYSLTNISNIKGVIINPSVYQFGEYFNVVKIILPDTTQRNILEVGSFDVNKNLF